MISFDEFSSVCVTRRGGELGVLRVREHLLNVEVHLLTAKSTPQNERKLNETPFQTDIHQSYGGFDVHIRLISVESSCNSSFRFELNGHQWKSTPSALAFRQFSTHGYT